MGSILKCVPPSEVHFNKKILLVKQIIPIILKLPINQNQSIKISQVESRLKPSII